MRIPFPSILIFPLLLPSLVMPGQVSIQGCVENEQGQPLSGAVALYADSLRDQTSPAGVFHVREVPTSLSRLLNFSNLPKEGQGKTVQRTITGKKITGNPESGLVVERLQKNNTTYFRLGFSDGNRVISGAVRENQSPLTKSTINFASKQKLEVWKKGYYSQTFQVSEVDSLTPCVQLKKISNPRGMRWIDSKNKTFQMGGNEGFFAAPAHDVTFTYGYWMDTTEVIQVDFDAIHPRGNSPWKRGDSLPVNTVSWFEAIIYCNARSIRDGLDTVYDPETGLSDLSRNGYRLPTEAEWEYACRGGTTTKYFWGESTDSAGLYAWSKENLEYGPNFFRKPALKRPNAYGLYDMSGNVFEWVHDYWYSYTAEAKIDPVTEPKHVDEVSYYINRGSSTIFTITYHSCTTRSRGGTNRFGYDESNLSDGFRVVLPGE